METIDLWDFGATANKCCSYTYHMPFSNGTQSFALSTSSEPGMAIASDRNPFISLDGTSAAPKLRADFVDRSTREGIKKGNAVQHQDEGQNVLFLDGHVLFEKSSLCGINEDNIFTPADSSWGGGQVTNVIPTYRNDSYLINDGLTAGGGVPPPPPKGRGCFLADTPVWVDGSLTDISNATAGQKVGKVNCVAMTAQLEKIEKVQVHEGSYECRDVELETGNTINVVDSHCFMLDSGSWVAAQDLKGGLKLKTLSGTVTIKSVVTRTKPFVGKVYNLKMAGTDRYPVGKDGVVVRDY